MKTAKKAPAFAPIQITLETPEEAALFWAMLQFNLEANVQAHLRTECGIAAPNALQQCMWEEHSTAVRAEACTPIPPPHIPELGHPYWTVAAWTSKGMRAVEVVWDDGMIDRRRLKLGTVFPDGKAADEYLDRTHPTGV